MFAFLQLIIVTRLRIVLYCDILQKFQNYSMGYTMAVQLDMGKAVVYSTTMALATDQR